MERDGRSIKAGKDFCGECLREAAAQQAFKRLLKCGIYKELHKRGMLSEMQLDKLISQKQ